MATAEHSSLEQQPRDEEIARKIGAPILGQTHNIDYYKRGTNDMIARSGANALRHQYLTSLDLDAPLLNAGEDYDN